MDVPLVIRRRLKDLGLEQRGLAAAAQVTESYVSQLLARKKAPPAPRRTDIYDKMEVFLQLPPGELARLAEIQRKEDMRKKLADPVPPLFRAARTLILRKCLPETRAEVRAIVEKDAYGELERFVARKLLDVARGVAKERSDSEKWVRLMARLGKRTNAQTSALIHELLEAGASSTAVEQFVSLLDPMIESWKIELETFAMEVILVRGITPGRMRRFEFVESQTEHQAALEPGLAEFLKDRSLSGDATEAEIEFLQGLDLKGRRPFPIYYYRELQNLRDPVHFRGSSPARH
ncbi:MAG: helix-turn-helix transcriptional regulator [Acidobacteriota bacterium]